MSQPLTVVHRSGQLAYPTWAAHTTHWPDLLVDGACRCEGSGQADQALRGVMLYVPYVRIGHPVAHSCCPQRNLCRLLDHNHSLPNPVLNETYAGYWTTVLLIRSSTKNFPAIGLQYPDCSCPQRNSCRLLDHNHLLPNSVLNETNAGYWTTV